ncbi:DUF4157 domain-containing protein [Aquimarina litoralis]|uniref:eCIS core domain-containing protein n=1 Tax=Aquimarina litoralis TaxID=584605 RepID=UPI001C5992D1|nr:DUF4157 domain-containing protein [Aquimarina litoralis]MBW1296269.1 DUF4157 domain-containing protein [Aquimarina litoralis]
MKAPLENVQNSEKDIVQRVQKEPSTGGNAAIADNRPAIAIQRKLQSAMGSADDINNPIQRKKNNTGLPDNLKTGIENLSGYSMDDVKVHYNSSKPTQLQAHAYAQGTDIHLAPGQEKHLPHEAWHVVQQKQGRVKPTRQLKSKVFINDDTGLEKEADLMGAKALQKKPSFNTKLKLQDHGGLSNSKTPVQLKTGFEVELDIPVYGNPKKKIVKKTDSRITEDDLFQIERYLGGGLGYGRSYGEDKNGYFEVTADHGNHSIQHRQLINSLYKKGYINSDKLPSMSNIEYRTPALEEREESSGKTMENIAGALKTHANDASEKSLQKTSNSLSAPTPNLYTGVPVKALHKLVEKDEELKSFVTEISKFHPHVYLQTSSGVLPSEIPTLFTEERERMAHMERVQKSPIGKAILAMYKKPVEIAKSKRTQIEQLLSRNVDQGYDLTDLDDIMELDGYVDAMVGFVTLLIQYLLAQQLGSSNYLGSDASPKNLLIHLAKTKVEDWILALPYEARPNLSNVNIAKDWEEFFFKLVDEVNEYSIVADVGLKKEKPGSRRVISNDHKKWIMMVLRGKKAPTITPGKTLGLDDGQENLPGALTIDGEQGIVLEDRTLLTKLDVKIYDIANLDKTLNEEWNRAVERRNKSLQDEMI